MCGAVVVVVAAAVVAQRCSYVSVAGDVIGPLTVTASVFDLVEDLGHCKREEKEKI